MISLQFDTVPQLAIVGPSHFHFDLTGNEFKCIQNDLPARVIPSFRFDHHPIFPS
jgi:hypothetical protein